MLKHTRTFPFVVCISAHLVAVPLLGFLALRAFLSGNAEVGLIALLGLIGWAGSIIFWLASMMAIHCLYESGIQPWVEVK